MCLIEKFTCYNKNRVSSLSLLPSISDKISLLQTVYKMSCETSS